MTNGISSLLPAIKRSLVISLLFYSIGQFDYTSQARKPEKSNSMHVRKTIMKLIDDCLYTLYVVTYTLGKKLRQRKS